ncbi:MAG: peptide chain release factor H [Arenicella sp.]|nr:peptide chain release factor H [Arenicella sp.]
MSKQETKLWLQITSGQGPDECALAARKLVSRIMKDARTAETLAELLDGMEGRKRGTYSSALLCLSGAKSEAFSKVWVGTIQWICESPYRNGYKRKNWFVGVSLIKLPSSENMAVRSCDVTWKTMRASGPGGQHMNTTDSAVQATHKPTGLQVSAGDARSQHVNKKLALEKLEAILASRQQESLAKQKQDHWRKHSNLERGNPVKVFFGKEFKQR